MVGDGLSVAAKEIRVDVERAAISGVAFSVSSAWPFSDRDRA
jgi:hypothetical protein